MKQGWYCSILFIIYLNFLVHNLNYPYIYSYKEWLCFTLIFSLVGVSDLGFWGPFGYLFGFLTIWVSLIFIESWILLWGLCRRLIFELIVVAVILVACLGFWFWMARLVLPCKGAGLARTGLLGLVSSAPVNTYFSFPQSWFCVCMCVWKKKKNLESTLIAALWLQTFFSFVHYITLFVLDLLFFLIGSMGMMRFYCQLFSFLLMFSL